MDVDIRRVQILIIVDIWRLATFGHFSFAARLWLRFWFV
jgi:hypothetical protein